MKIALYARVATQRLDGQGGIALQIESLRAHASKQAFEVVEAYVCCDAGYSGASLNRPGLDRLRYGVETKAFDGVVILSPDRLSRDCGDLVRMIEEFERCAVPIVFVEEGLDVALPHHGIATILQNDPPDSKGHHEG